VFRAQGATAIESLTATFISTTITVDGTTAPAIGGLFAGENAWVAAPAGDELTAATAQVDRDGATLVLVTACTAEPSLPAPTTAGPLVGLVPQVTPAPLGPTTSAAATAVPPVAPLETLPIAGTDVAEIAELGAGMVLTGVLLILFRGRRPKPVAEPDEDDIRRPAVLSRRS
jgi:hypothetical protein